MHKIKSLLLFLLLTISIFPQKIIDKQLQIGLDKIYNFNWDDGKKAFNSVIEKYPDDPRGYHHKSIIYLWHYLGNFSETYLDSFHLFADKAIELAEKQKSIKSTADLNYLIGSVYYNKSVAEARSGNYLQALYASNQMKENLDDALKLRPDYYDAYLGLGLYNFALSQIPSTLEWAANLVGMNADKELGLEYVKKTAEKGKLSKIDAQFYLSQLYSRVIVDHPEAKELLTSLVKRYPKNLLFNFSLAWVRYELNDLAGSEKNLQNIFTSKDTLFPFVVSNSYYLMGNILFCRNMFDSAKTFYQSFLDMAVNDDYKGIANLKMGFCNELTGHRKEAMQFYEKSSSGNNDIEEDFYAKRKGDELIEKKLSENQIRLLHYANLIKQSKLSAARDSLILFVNRNKINNEQIAEANLYLSQIFFYQKNYKVSISYAVNSLKTEIESEYWIHAFASYYAAWDSYYNKNYIDSKLFLLRIEEQEDFDFRNSLMNKVYSLKRVLPAERDK